jgi:ABC-type transporter Mla subunit MlaD
LIRRIAAAATVVTACVIVVLLSAAGGGAPAGTTIKMAFDNAFGLTPGGDLRVAGVKAGQTTKFDVSKGPECQLGHPDTNPPRTCAIVTGTISTPGFQSFRKDAVCDIRQQSLIGEYYVDCQPGSSQRQLGKEIIPDTQTASTIPADLVGDVLRQPFRDRLRIIITELGTGLAGRPQDIQQLLQHAAPGLQQTDQVLRILANQSDVIKNFISNAQTVTAALDQRKRDVANWITQAGRTAQISATRAGDISRGFQLLPTFLNELRPTMRDLGNLIDQQTPLLVDLRRAAPELTTTFTRLGPFSNASIPAFRALGQASVAGSRAFKDSSKDIAELKLLAKDAPGTGKPLRQFLQTLDNRQRAPDVDIRAQQDAPPSPDPTSYQKSGCFNRPSHLCGYTGMEALANFLYYQTLTVNQFDTIGHTLRILLVPDKDCSNYQSKPAPTRCNSFLGPFQPGVTVPDPSNTDHFFASPVSPKPGATRTAGQPPATKPLPGQTDFSKPHPTLLPSLQGLLNSLTGNGTPTPATPNLPAASTPQTSNLPQANDPGAAQQALDYLLSP